MLDTVNLPFIVRRKTSGVNIDEAILFLCSKEARWITGLIMPVDAGVSKVMQMSRNHVHV